MKQIDKSPKKYCIAEYANYKDYDDDPKREWPNSAFDTLEEAIQSAKDQIQSREARRFYISELKQVVQIPDNVEVEEVVY